MEKVAIVALSEGAIIKRIKARLSDVEIDAIFVEATLGKILKEQNADLFILYIQEIESLSRCLNAIGSLDKTKLIVIGDKYEKIEFFTMFPELSGAEWYDRTQDMTFFPQYVKSYSKRHK